MTDIPEEMVERITPTADNTSLNVATRAIVQTALGSLTPEDLDTLARRHGLVVARDVDVKEVLSKAKPAIVNSLHACGWNQCREAMLGWREADVDDD